MGDETVTLMQAGAHPTDRIYNDIQKKWIEADHLDYDGTCICDCPQCSSEGDEEECCICPDCNVERCDLHVKEA